LTDAFTLFLQARLDERDRAHDAALADKADAVEDLQRRLGDAQRRLAETLADSGGGQVSQRTGQQGPLEELCGLRTALAEASHAADERENKIRDLTDELAATRSKLRAGEERADLDNQRESARLAAAVAEAKDQQRRAEHAEQMLADIRLELDAQRARLDQRHAAEATDVQREADDLRAELMRRGEETQRERQQEQKRREDLQVSPALFSP